MVYPIRLYGDPVLRRKARPVEDFSGIKRLAEDMLETMFEAKGVGLAAPQIGLSQRLFVAVEYADEPEGEEERPLRELVRRVYVVANPVITYREGLVEGTEGCLSLPGLYSEEVPRAERIRVEYQDEEGRGRVLELEGYMARVFQHEIDHLLGVLMTDRADEVFRMVKTSDGNYEAVPIENTRIVQTTTRTRPSSGWTV